MKLCTASGKKTNITARAAVKGDREDALTLDRCPLRDEPMVGNIAQTQSEISMNKSTVPINDILMAAQPLSTSDALGAYQQQAKLRVAQHKDELRRVLLNYGIVRIAAEYDGCGDSGQIDSIAAWNANNEPIPLPTMPEQMPDLHSFFDDLLEQRHPGWENNDGALGEFVWNLVTDELSHVHHDRYTEIDTTEHHGL